MRQVRSRDGNRVRLHLTCPYCPSTAHYRAQRHRSAAVKQASQLHVLGWFAQFPEGIFDKEQCVRQRHTIAPHGILCCHAMQAVMPAHQCLVAFSAATLHNFSARSFPFDFAISGIYFTPEWKLLWRGQRCDFCPPIREALQSAAFQWDKTADNPVR